MQNGFLGISWLVWAGLAIVIAVIFAVFVPNREAVMASTGLTFIIVRWFHSLVWVLLALWFVLLGLGVGERANPVGLLAGLTYAVFIVTFIRL